MNELKNWLRGEKITAVLISIFFLLFYVYFQTITIYGGDGGDVVTAAYVGGIAHPPGYPLYTFLAWLATKIPYSTIAWRVSLLSSIPLSIALGFLYLIIQQILRTNFIPKTNKFTNFLAPENLTAIITTFIFGFSYLVWLYAITPEVFGLYILFLTIFIWLMLNIEKIISSPTQQIFALAFFTGLSLTHHHTILFILPAVIYYLYPKYGKFFKKLSGILIFKICFFLIIGLLPYIYVYFAALGNPVVNWENPQTLDGFIRLITRSVYGSFRSNSIYVATLSDRYKQIFNFFESILVDFKLVSFLSIPGLIFLYKTQKRLAIFTILAFILSGPIYLFYAGFPLFSNFHFGSVERFYLAPYLIFMIWYAAGIYVVSQLINKIIYKYFSNLKVETVLLFLMIALFSFVNNYPKNMAIKYDLTAEKLGNDILDTAPNNSIILVSSDDTAYLNTLYVYLTQNYLTKPNRKIFLSGAMLRYPFYAQSMRKLYPEIVIPQEFKDPQNPTPEFIYANFHKYAIFSNVEIELTGNYYWTPYGLLLKLNNNSKTLITEIKADNEKITTKYQQPLDGALKTYQHLILSDVLRVYAFSYVKIAKIMLISQEFIEADKYLNKSKQLFPQFIDVDLNFAISYLVQKKCSEAKNVIDNLENLTSNLEALEKIKLKYKEVCGS